MEKNEKRGKKKIENKGSLCSLFQKETKNKI